MGHKNPPTNQEPTMHAVAAIESETTTTNEVAAAAKRISRRRAPKAEPSQPRAKREPRAKKVAAEKPESTKESVAFERLGEALSAGLKKPEESTEAEISEIEVLRARLEAAEAQLEHATTAKGRMNGAIPVALGWWAIRKDVTDIVESILGDHGPAYIPVEHAEKMRALLRGDLKPSKGLKKV